MSTIAELERRIAALESSSISDTSLTPDSLEIQMDSIRSEVESSLGLEVDIVDVDGDVDHEDLLRFLFVVKSFNPKIVNDVIKKYDYKSMKAISKAILGDDTLLTTPVTHKLEYQEDPDISVRVYEQVYAIMNPVENVFIGAPYKYLLDMSSVGRRAYMVKFLDMAHKLNNRNVNIPVRSSTGNHKQYRTFRKEFFVPPSA